MPAFFSSRRCFLKNTGAAIAGMPLLPSLVRDLIAQDAGLPRAEAISTLFTSCGLCDSACGMKATLKDGRLTFVEGLAEDLQGGGKLCGKGKAAPGFLYDPDRLKYPLVRTNPVKGIGVDPGWKRVTWDEALELAADKLKTTI